MFFRSKNVQEKQIVGNNSEYYNSDSSGGSSEISYFDDDDISQDGYSVASVISNTSASILTALDLVVDSVVDSLVPEGGELHQSIQRRLEPLALGVRQSKSLQDISETKPKRKRRVLKRLFRRKRKSTFYENIPTQESSTHYREHSLQPPIPMRRLPSHKTCKIYHDSPETRLENEIWKNVNEKIKSNFENELNNKCEEVEVILEDFKAVQMGMIRTLSFRKQKRSSHMLVYIPTKEPVRKNKDIKYFKTLWTSYTTEKDDETQSTLTEQEDSAKKSGTFAKGPNHASSPFEINFIEESNTTAPVSCDIDWCMSSGISRSFSCDNVIKSDIKTEPGTSSKEERGSRIITFARRALCGSSSKKKLVKSRSELELMSYHDQCEITLKNLS